MNNPAQTMNVPAQPGMLWGQLPREAMAPSLRHLSGSEFQSIYDHPSQRIITDCWLLELITSGSLAIRVDDGPWVSRPQGRGVLYAPGAAYHEKAASPAPGGRRITSLYIRFAFDGECPLSGLMPRKGRHVLVRDGQGNLEDLLGQMVYMLSSGNAGGQLHALGCFYQILGLLRSATPKSGELVLTDMRSSLPEIVMRMHQYMRENLAAPIRLREIAAELGLSESGLSHAYRRLTGKSPMQALRALRLEAARQKLIRGRWKLQAIAEQTGFADAFHLSRSFRKYTGQSPQQYLKRLGRS